MTSRFALVGAAKPLDRAISNKGEGVAAAQCRRYAAPLRRVHSAAISQKGAAREQCGQAVRREGQPARRLFCRASLAKRSSTALDCRAQGAAGVSAATP